MRLSDAIALGRTLCLPWEKGNRGTGFDRRCALQLASLAANGGKDWLENLPAMQASFGYKLTVAVPCGCRDEGEWPHDGNASLHRAVMHMFNHHVCTLGDWTLDQLVDWVRSVEPPELEETANGDSAQTSAATNPVCAK